MSHSGARRRPSWLGLAALFLAVGFAGPAFAQDCGGVGDDADCDQDGFTVGEGDCNDDEPSVRPGAADTCGDQLDNNCDGMFDEGCDRSAQIGSIRGGGGCTGGSGVAGTAWIFLPLLVRRRRRG